MWPGDAKDHKNTLLPGRYCAHQGASKHKARTKEVGVVEARDSSSSPPQVQPLPRDLLQVSSEVSCPRCWRGSPSLAQRACSCRSDRLSREGGKQALKNGKTWDHGRQSTLKRNHVNQSNLEGVGTCLWLVLSLRDSRQPLTDSWERRAWGYQPFQPFCTHFATPFEKLVSSIQLQLD